MAKGILVVLSGFSGAGKGTIVKELMEQYSDELSLSISATTRAPREGEQEGVHYFYVSKERFEEMIAQDELIEHAQFVGNYYGTPKAYVESQMAASKSVILEIEMQGALQIKKKFPETKLIFISTPDADTLRERLTGRGTETEEVIADRLAQANKDATYMPHYDYLVINDTLDKAVADVHAIIAGECTGNPQSVSSMKISENSEFISKITEELKSFLKGDN